MTPPAAPVTARRPDEEGDWIARQFFPPEDLRLSPEEYVARNAHALVCFSFHLFRYRDPALGEWVRQVGWLLTADGEVERCRDRFLTPAEMAAVLRQQAEDL